MSLEFTLRDLNHAHMLSDGGPLKRPHEPDAEAQHLEKRFACASDSSPAASDSCLTLLSDASSFSDEDLAPLSHLLKDATGFSQYETIESQMSWEEVQELVGAGGYEKDINGHSTRGVRRINGAPQDTHMTVVNIQVATRTCSRLNSPPGNRARH